MCSFYEISPHSKYLSSSRPLQASPQAAAGSTVPRVTCGAVGTRPGSLRHTRTTTDRQQPGGRAPDGCVSAPGQAPLREADDAGLGEGVSRDAAEKRAAAGGRGGVPNGAELSTRPPLGAEERPASLGAAGRRSAGDN